MRIVRLALVAAVVSAGVAVTAPHEAAIAGGGSGGITDPRLLAEIAQLDGPHSSSTEATPRVSVEVLTADDAAISAQVVALGGTVTGSVIGEVVQADVPVARLQALAGNAAATSVRFPRRAGYIPGATRREEVGPGTGTVGSEVSITNAAAWQAAGQGGAGVRVGVVDYFDFSVWNPAEHGPAPSVGNGHMFCKDSTNFGLCSGGAIVSTSDGDHGVAVVEVVKDMAPLADVYIATVGTVSDLQSAIDWFSANGVTIVTRSLGAAYDGPGDGTGPLAAVVDHAAALGLVWFNSAGNDAVDAYMRRDVPTDLGANGYVDFDRGPGVDTWLRIDAGFSVCGALLDGVRWSNDWYLPAAQRTDYSLEFWEPLTMANENDSHENPASMAAVKGIDLDRNSANGIQNVYDADQRAGEPPLEADDLCAFPQNLYGNFGGVVYMRVKRNAATPVGATPDQLEIALGDGLLEEGYYDVAGSASKPVVDSKNPSLVSVGAVDPPAGSAIGIYSSQGPTFDGRTKPDLSAPAGFTSVAWGGTFSGTSAASPVAAGAAALLQGAGLAVPGRSLAALVKHFVNDLGTPGPDNAFGAGKVLLPAAPAPLNTAPGKYVPFATPNRVFDSRGMAAPGLGAGPYPPLSIVDVSVLTGVPVAPSSVSAVAVNVTSTRTSGFGFIQASPFLGAATGGTSTLNIAVPGNDRPNFAIVPVGRDGKISLYLDAGGDVIVDVLGWFQTGSATSTDGRFVSISPERWMDTRNAGLFPAGVGTAALTPANGIATARRPGLTAVPATGVKALVVNVTAANSAAPGYMVAMPSGGNPAATQHSTVNYTPATPSANTAIVAVGADGSVAVFTTAATNIIVDVVGYITDTTAADTTAGLFQPITPTRAYDSRQAPLTAFAAGEARTMPLNTVAGVAPNASAVSSNLTAIGTNATGFLTVFPTTEPSTSNLNFGPGQVVANGSLLRLSPSGTVTAKMNEAAHLLIDINGFFLS